MSPGEDHPPQKDLRAPDREWPQTTPPSILTSLYLLDCFISDSLTSITLENLNPGTFYSTLSSTRTLTLQGAPWTPAPSPPSLHWPQRVSPRPPPREDLLPLLKDPETRVSPSTAPLSLQDNSCRVLFSLMELCAVSEG